MPVHHRTCTLCDALCRLRIDHDDDGTIRRVAGAPDDPWSQGHICPKGVAIQDLHTDPDRLRTPLLRTPDGFVPIGWDEALARAAEGLAAVRRAHGRDAVGVYIGNPNAHHAGNLLGVVLLLQVLGTRARFSAQSVDNLPHLYAALHVFGHQLLFGVPDVDRTDHVLILGANPWASNGGGLSSGDVRKRLTGVQARGGRLVVVDPRRTETAAIADRHHFLRPGTDALLMLAMLHVLVAEDRIDDGPWRAWCTGVDEVCALARRFPPERVADATGLSADTIRTLARELSDAPRATIYARIGVCTQRFGGLSAWLVHVLHAVTGNLDREGGLMFPRPAIDTIALTRWLGARGHVTPGASRVSDLPGFADELPLATLADEITTPGAGQVRGLITLAGNPALSAPDGPRLQAALDTLDFHVAVDLYLNETAARAHLVLPAASPLQRPHYPLGLASIAVRTVASWSEPMLPLDGGRDDFDILADLAAGLAAAERRHGWRLLVDGVHRVGIRRVVDLLLRAGPHGRWRGGGLDLATLAASAHTVDLGPPEPSFPARLATPDRRAHLAPAPLVADVARLEAALDAGELAPPLVLIGRRDLRSNNSWMHNSPRLLKGRDRCTLLVHPDDAARYGVVDGQEAELASRAGRLRVPVEVSDTVRPGVVSLPHGWGHDHDGVRLSVAATRPGVSANDVTDHTFVDALTGTAALSGLPVTLAPV
ncbi:MAG: molybdopterin-dependent oxidoreductase [Alphaproteobacteria bacterium]|nr:molybdopterin-dependent oxidoreductase [Alphaproteobacteria bacterium]